MRSSRFVRYAPKAAKYLVTALSDALPKARRLLFAAPLSAADGGDGGSYTVSIGGATASTRGAVKLAGQLGGTADSPDVRGLRVLDSGSPTFLALGEVQDGEVLARNGTSVVGASVLSTSGGSMTGDLAMAGHKLTGLASGTATGDAATYGQLTSMLNGLDWQASVVSAINTPPTPTAGVRHLVTATASGDWTGHEKKISEGTGSGWIFIVPSKGTTVHNEATGQDLVYDNAYPSGNWVNIGTSVDHASLLNLNTGNPHPQYQLGSAREAANGYAGLGSDNLPIRPTRGVRIGGDPGSPGPGELWVVGADLKFRNDMGSPATEVVERQARRNQASGYAGLDGGGRVAAAQAPVKATYAAGGDQAMAPADIGAVATGRQVATGLGLSGGGNLTADRTLSIAAFTGFVSKDFDPAQLSWNANEVKVHVTYDIGVNGALVPTALRLPATVNASLSTEAVFELDDASTVIISNTNTGSVLDSSMQALADALLGGAAAGPANNGRSGRKVSFQTRNTTGSPVNNVDVGVYRVRAHALPRGGGSPL